MSEWDEGTKADVANRALEAAAVACDAVAERWADDAQRPAAQECARRIRSMIAPKEGEDDERDEARAELAKFKEETKAENERRSKILQLEILRMSGDDDA